MDRLEQFREYLLVKEVKLREKETKWEYDGEFELIRILATQNMLSQFMNKD